MQVLKKTHIRVSIDNKELLEKKKRKLRLNSVNEVITVLLQKEDEYSTLKKIKRKKSQNVPIATSKEKPKTEMLSLNGRCVFKHERQDGNVDCAKDFIEKNAVHVLTNEQCMECWNNAFHVPINPESS
jgi:hypothetical protein